MKNISIFLSALFIFLTIVLKSQNDSVSGYRPYRVILNFGPGIGFHSLATGIITNHEKQVEIDCGGGNLGLLGFGYTIKNKYELDLSLLIQGSEIYPAIRNGKGEFNRSFLNLTGRYFLPFGKRRLQQVNFGIGLMQILNASMTFDFSQIPDRGFEEFEFKKNLGGNLLVEYELYFSKRKHFSFGGGIDYHFLRYKLESAKIDGQVISSSDYKDKFIYNMPGDGINIYFKISYSFGKLSKMKK